MKNTQFFHQGDVPFFPIDREVSGEKTIHDGRLTLAWGEATGHHHTIHVPNVEDMDAMRTEDGGWLLTLRAPGVVRHQEHHEITLPPGNYKVGGEREKDWFSLATRRVID